MPMNSAPTADGDVQIRNAHEDDRVARDLPILTPDSDGPRWRRTLVAVLDGQVVGVGTLAHSIAIDSYFCEVNVSPHVQRRGIGTTLFKALRALPDQSLPVLGRAMGSHPIRRDFSEHLGGSVLVHCPMPGIDPTSAPGREWANLQTTPSGYQIRPASDVSTDKVRAAWGSYFVWSHTAFGAIRPEGLRTVWDGYRSGVDNDLSQVCVDSTTGHIVAFSMVSPNGWEGRTFVVAETVQRDQANGVALLLATVAASLKVLSDRGFQWVEIEGHSTDPHVPSLVQSLPAGPSDPLDIYLLGVSTAV